MEMERTMDAHKILSGPYARLVTPDMDGSFFAEIVEFPGCFATGKTAPEALQNLESVAVDWINTALAQGQNIPEPMESNDYSGKFVLRMPKGLHRRAALWAEREGASLNQFIVMCVAEQVGERARPLMVYAQPLQVGATINFQVTAGVALAPATTAVVGYGGASSKFAASGHQLIPIQIQREAVRA
jgi:antitoxin HicB